MTELETYLDLASREIDATNGSETVEHMEAVVRAISRMGVLLCEAEHRLGLKERSVREGLSQYDFPESKVKEEVRMECLDEITTVKVIKSGLIGLNKRFDSLRSALSFLKTQGNYH